METTGVCEIDVETRRIVGGSDSPPDLDSPCQVNTTCCFVCSLSYYSISCIVMCPVFNVCGLAGGVSYAATVKLKVT